MIKAAIFDMDGLLIDSEPMWHASHIEALAKHDVIINEDDVRAMAGKRTDEVVRHWRETYNIEHVPNDSIEIDVVSRLIERVKLNGQSLPGVDHVIQIFESNKIPMAVASSSSPEIIEAVLNRLGIAKYMKLAYSAKNEQFGKPHPGVFLTTAKKLGVSSGECLVFEDSLSGIKAAKAAGMVCIAVPEPVNRHKPEFSIADLIADSLEDIDWSTITELVK
jgi:HAD superfamily hydrolase (TIGR01509 family)